MSGVMRKIIIGDFVAPEEIETQDGGQAKIFELSPDPLQRNGFFVRLQSWDETKRHEVFQTLIGKKIRVTIEEAP